MRPGLPAIEEAPDFALSGLLVFVRPDNFQGTFLIDLRSHLFERMIGVVQ